MKTVEEKNQMIAEFMGYKMMFRPIGGDFIELSANEICDLGNLKYHTSWDWLMPVVEKIEDIQDRDELSGTHFFDVEIRQQVVFINGADIEVSEYGSKMENTFEAICEFVEWYNKNK